VDGWVWSLSLELDTDHAQEDEMVSDDVGSGVDPEKDSSHYMAVLVEALSILGRVQDALDVSVGGCGLWMWSLLWVWFV
jgi:hypothetical protein